MEALGDNRRTLLRDGSHTERRQPHRLACFKNREVTQELGGTTSDWRGVFREELQLLRKDGQADGLRLGVTVLMRILPRRGRRLGLAADKRRAQTAKDADAPSR
jgi:hypothetical protein